MAKKQKKDARDSPDAAMSADIASLASYEPRARAMEMLAKGEIDAALDWVMGDGYVAAQGEPRKTTADPARRERVLFEMFPLDEALLFDRIPRGLEAQGTQEAVASVDLYGASPFEVILRRGDAKAFETALRMVASPELRKRASHKSFDAGWCSLNARAPIEYPARKRWIYEPTPHGLLALAAMLGLFERAEMMIRAGFAPDDMTGWGDLVGIAHEARRADLPGRLATYGVGGGAEAGWSWLDRKRTLSMDLEEACREAPSPGEDGVEAIANVRAIIRQGFAPGSQALAAATRLGDPGLLAEMFAAGANPNALYKGTNPLLCGFGDELTRELLQVWLDAGADPSACISGAFGRRDCPSPLFQWTWKGRLDLIQQAAEQARGPVPMTIVWKGQRYSTLLAVAMERDHGDIVRWLIEERGCRLGDRVEESQDPCSSYGTPEIREMAFACQDRAELSAPGAVPLGKSVRREPFL